MNIYLYGVAVFLIILTVVFSVVLSKKYNKPDQEDYAMAAVAVFVLSAAWPVTLLAMGVGVFMASIYFVMFVILDM